MTRQAINRFLRQWGVPTYGARNLVDADALHALYYPRIDAGMAQVRTRDAYGRPWSPGRAALSPVRDGCAAERLTVQRTSASSRPRS